MKRILLCFVLPLCAVVSAFAQNNPYAIDDECYSYFMQAEALVGDLSTDVFEEANAKLLATALAKGDEKARTLYYVCALRRASRIGQKAPLSERAKHNEAVEAARKQLMAVAKETGYSQYYYFAFELAQTYYFNTHQNLEAVNVLTEMLEESRLMEDDYGQWQSLRYIAQLYQRQYDRFNARRYIQEALGLFEKSRDPVLLRQPVTRLYCDLADTYIFASDSSRLYYRKAREGAILPLDTLRCVYYEAQLAAHDGDRATYEALKKTCLDNPQFESIFRSGPLLFQLTDRILREDEPEEREVRALNYPQQRFFISQLAEVHGMWRLSAQILDRQLYLTEHNLMNINEARLDEISARFGNTALRTDLSRASQKVTRITILVAVLLTLILVGALAFSWFYIRNLKKTNQKVRMADAAKTRFVQNMSHEVRTPLNAIVGFSQLLSLPDGSFPEEEKNEFAGHIVNNTKMLTMLLDDILNASAMDSGNYRIAYEDAECHFICAAAISSAEHRLQPGVRMYYAPESSEPFGFRTDPRRVQQILINLLTNACKHTTSGEIRLSSSLTEHPGYVTFSVTDTGTGVPPEDAEKIFERFTKLNDFVQGTGLGLSICRDIAGRMGGRVFLDTSYTGGARFVFTVPIHPDESNATA